MIKIGIRLVFPKRITCFNSKFTSTLPKLQLLLFHVNSWYLYLYQLNKWPWASNFHSLRKVSETLWGLFALGDRTRLTLRVYKSRSLWRPEEWCIWFLVAWSTSNLHQCWHIRDYGAPLQKAFLSTKAIISDQNQNFLRLGAAWHKGYILASQPAAPGSILLAFLKIYFNVAKIYWWC